MPFPLSVTFVVSIVCTDWSLSLDGGIEKKVTSFLCHRSTALQNNILNDLRSLFPDNLLTLTTDFRFSITPATLFFIIVKDYARPCQFPNPKNRDWNTKYSDEFERPDNDTIARRARFGHSIWLQLKRSRQLTFSPTESREIQLDVRRAWTVQQEH